MLNFVFDLFCLWSGACPDILLVFNFVRGFVRLLWPWVLWLMFGISFGIMDGFSDNDLILTFGFIFSILFYIYYLRWNRLKGWPLVLGGLEIHVAASPWFEL